MLEDRPEGQPDATLKAGQKETPVYTQGDIDKAVRDARSAVLADAGRAKKAAEDALARLDKLEKERAEAELEAARDDPDKLTGIQERQRRMSVQSELEKARQELSEKDELLKGLETEKAETTRAQSIQTIASRFNVDSARLAKLAKLTDGTAEAIEELARELPALGGKPGLRPDSSGAIGGQLSREQIIANYTLDPRNRAYKERYLELRREEGR